MPQTDIAKRVYDHTWKLDPIIRSLLDTDFYKLLMLQMIWGLYRDVSVTFLACSTRAARIRGWQCPWLTAEYAARQSR